MGRALRLLIVSALLLSILPMVYQINSSTAVSPFVAAYDQWAVQQYLSSTCSQAPAMVVVPCSTATNATGLTGIVTDWATTSVSLTPSSPNVGDQVTFSMVITTVSSQGAFPQEARVGCFVDSTFEGGQIVTYPGPVGAPMTVQIQTPWTAVAGTHTLTCGVGTIPAGLDPNKSNNLMSTTFTVSTPVLTGLTEIATYTGAFTSTSSSGHMTLIGITIPSMYIFDYSASLNAPPATGGTEYPGTVDAGKCSNTTSCAITIDTFESGSGTSTPAGCAEYCSQATITISVNFPSSEATPEPVTLTVSGLPAGSTFSWGNELPASTLAPYTAMPPYTVTLTIYTSSLYTPDYGSPFPYPCCNPAPPADVITITGASHDSFPHTLATITLTVNESLPDCVLFATNPNPNALVDCTTTRTYP